MNEEKLKDARSALIIKKGLGFGHWLKFTALIFGLYYGGIFLQVGVDALRVFTSHSLRSATLWLVDLQLHNSEILMQAETIRGLDKATNADLIQTIYKLKSESINCTETLNSVRASLGMEDLAVEMEERALEYKKSLGNGKANVTIK